MMNRVILVGRITKDPEIKYTQSNIPVVTFTLAVNRSFTDQQGERQADFISCVVWRKQAENLHRFVSKGALLGVEGRIQTRQYETESGTRYVTEVLAESIQFLESKNEGSAKEKSSAPEDDFYEVNKKIAAEEDLPF